MLNSINNSLWVLELVGLCYMTIMFVFNKILMFTQLNNLIIFYNFSQCCYIGR